MTDDTERDEMLGRLYGAFPVLQTAIAAIIRELPEDARARVLSELEEIIKHSTGTGRGDPRAGREETAEWLIKRASP